MAATPDLGLALQDDMIDLDELQRAGNTDADAALDVIRGHIGPTLDDVRPDVPRRRRHGRPRLTAPQPRFALQFRLARPNGNATQTGSGGGWRSVGRHRPGWRNWQTRGA